MKVCYIQDILNRKKLGEKVEILGWVALKRKMTDVIFFDLVDSTGKIQAVASNDSNAFDNAKEIRPESSVMVEGIIKHGTSNTIEVEIEKIEVIGDVILQVNPKPRSQFDIFNEKYVDRILANRHIYVRNEKLMSIFRFRHILIKIIRDWFDEEGFIEFHPPILTELLLYDDESTAFKLKYFGKDIFLTQCVAFYLESGIHAFEKVYSINPSFRAESSTGKRHLAEYWHVKSEIAFADIEDIISFVENMISYIIQRITNEAKNELDIFGIEIDENELATLPYPRISYGEALDRLTRLGIEKEYGKSLSAKDEASLSKGFNSPFWITGLPCSIEPFPYKIDDFNSKSTKTADLIATDGFGEILGVAEKIWESEELFERMKERGKEMDERYEWYCELRQFGSVPHSGFGMGLERLIRWLLKLQHVRDAIPFPRLIRRNPNP